MMETTFHRSRIVCPQREDERRNDSISITLRSAKELANTLGMNKPYKAYLFSYVESLDAIVIVRGYCI